MSAQIQLQCSSPAEEGQIHRTCAYNTDQEPDGLWGQCYEGAYKYRKKSDGTTEWYCCVHAAWVTHSGKCRDCGETITYETWLEYFMSTGGDDEVPCKTCAGIKAIC